MLFSCSSKKQTILAQSTNETKIIAANEAGREALYIDNILRELSDKPTELFLYTDNKGVNKFAIGGVCQKTKPLDLWLRMLFNLRQKKQIRIKYLNTKYNVADLFTKFVNKNILKSLRPRLNLVRKTFKAS